MPILNKSQHTNIVGKKNVFTDVAGNLNQTSSYTTNNIQQQHISVAYRQHIDGKQILYRHMARGALHNARERFDAPRCHEDTRHAIQTDLTSWICRSEPLDNINCLLWLKGPAGAGKSAIQQTVAIRCHADGFLAASFFFSHQSPERNHDGRFVATLAYQLAQKVESACDHIKAAALEDLTIFDQDTPSQLRVLVLEPLEKAALENPGAVSSWPKVVIIDGLDECKDEQQQVGILEALQLAALSPHFPFSIILASRPETAIREFFEALGELHTQKIALDQSYDATADIEILLRSHFRTMCRKYRIPEGTWPAEEDILALVENSSGQFIYASTALKFIGGPNRRPRENLQQVLEVKVRPGATGNPFAQLDALYTSILDRIPGDDRIEALVAILAINKYSWFTAADINTFFQYDGSECIRIFGRLHSLLDVPDRDDERSRYRFYHKTLVDFLGDPARCGDLYIDLATFSTKMCSVYMKFCSERSPSWTRLSKSLTTQTKETFIDVIVAFLRSSNLRDPAFRTEILSYNIEWWVTERIRCPPSNCPTTNKTRSEAGLTPKETLSALYRTVHAVELGCSLVKCSDTCKRWRKAIVKQCRKANWSVPSPFSRFGHNIVPPVHQTDLMSNFTFKVILSHP
ncbi:hypothetical protein FA15DRAFT_670595 [Coprinopsis marcescibilis]|uniref:Nephrocystin 3-like N-terminal domain-containing protein n=1 Tax=Coprinopsis marcescibilis TaxID=230819 RepID=A0A5C3KSA6_COPMA|nr:hypothetical protein FA15DRAFT_670595 [Coprinopsis marcescibilis]